MSTVIVPPAGKPRGIVVFGPGAGGDPARYATLIEAASAEPESTELLPQLGAIDGQERRMEIRPISVDEWAQRAASSELAEDFASGPPGVITPVSALVIHTATISTPTPGFGPLARRLRDELTGIQYGTRPDRLGWLRPTGTRTPA